jgi:hypothetical protein
MSRSSSAEAQTKLQEALQRLEGYDDDTDVAILGTVLIGLHGALENHLRELLFHHAPLSREEKYEVVGDRGVRRAGWLTLVNWMGKYFGLTKADRRLMLDANELRNDFAHSGSLSPGKLLIKDLRHYAEFVQDCFDRTWTLESDYLFEDIKPIPETTPNPEIPPSYLPTPPPPRKYSPPPYEPTQNSSVARESAALPKQTVRSSKPIGGGADWIVKNAKGVLWALLVTMVSQWILWIVILLVEACHLAPSGTAGFIAPAAGMLIGLVAYFEMQAAGLGLAGTEWSIFSVMGLAVVYIPALLMGWIGKSLFPTGNSFLAMAYYGGFGALLGLVLGIAQYQVLYPRRLNAQGWVLASVLDWSLCLGFVPLLKFLRPEVETSSVATIVLPIAGFLLGKAVTGLQIRRLLPF